MLILLILFFLVIYPIGIYFLTTVKLSYLPRIKRLKATKKSFFFSWISSALLSVIAAALFYLFPAYLYRGKISSIIIFGIGHIWGIRKGRKFLQQYIEQMHTKIDDAKNKLKMSAIAERAEAIMLLNKMKDMPEAVALLCRTLHDGDATIREQAAKTLIAPCSQAYTIVFRNGSFGMTQRDLHVQVFETLLLPRRIIIDPASCDMRQVEAFAAFTLPGFPPELLAKFTVEIEGNPSMFAAPVYRIFQRCKAVVIAIETVTFTQSSDEDIHLPTLWQNPDVLAFQLPLHQLRRIEIDTTSADPIRIERFLTYALEYMGQEFLRLNVIVHIDGSLNALSQNLRNNLANLCKRLET